MVHVAGAVTDLPVHAVVGRSCLTVPPHSQRGGRDLHASTLEDPISDGVLIEPNSGGGAAHRDPHKRSTD